MEDCQERAFHKSSRGTDSEVDIMTRFEVGEENLVSRSVSEQGDEEKGVKTKHRIEHIIRLNPPYEDKFALLYLPEDDRSSSAWFLINTNATMYYSFCSHFVD
jgi:hypothetical protein